MRGFTVYCSRQYESSMPELFSQLDIGTGNLVELTNKVDQVNYDTQCISKN